MQKTLYIFSNGTLQREGNTLCYITEEGKRFLPVEDIQEIMVFGAVDFNKSLLEFLTQHEILLHYFNYHDYYMGTFYPREHYNSGFVILKQAEHYMEEAKRLTLAKKFVAGALRNIEQVLRYYERRGIALGDTLSEFTDNETQIESITDLSELMAYEGNHRETYYRCFDKILDHPDFPFDKRTRRPPQNNLNTLISFGNSILYTIVLSEIYKTHLDPRIGYLHATNFRRFSLNLDVAEIFKPIIIDRLIFTLIDRQMLTKKDFEAETGGIVLKEKGRKVFVEELDKRLSTTISHRAVGHPVSYRRLIRMELYKVEKHLMGEESYKPFVSQW
ncbi:CRISPR-associated Cas1 family protein [Hydrogenispora ethanolica]|uniref:CRISPR-associated endonuclease Cas1 n=1 Tax=Hydrogenispora ethanolica TaxID=1082276 RepID=A0A4R1RQ12_HYDET|nr:type I-B CRISPR-associated endonuclease Cas1b [Hydrogenispora ethanolica]TCL68465.1 CRISPR-associated Cas1 family protein [Hydrogenispora ethanolica]